jgi:hypothetical protein
MIWELKINAAETIELHVSEEFVDNLRWYMHQRECDLSRALEDILQAANNYLNRKQVPWALFRIKCDACGEEGFAPLPIPAGAAAICGECIVKGALNAKENKNPLPRRRYSN